MRRSATPGAVVRPGVVEAGARRGSAAELLTATAVGVREHRASKARGSGARPRTTRSAPSTLKLGAANRDVHVSDDDGPEQRRAHGRCRAKLTSSTAAARAGGHPAARHGHRDQRGKTRLQQPGKRRSKRSLQRIGAAAGPPHRRGGSTTRCSRPQAASGRDGTRRHAARRVARRRRRAQHARRSTADAGRHRTSSAATLVNGSATAQSKVPVFAVAQRGGKVVVGAGRAVVARYSPGRARASAPFQVFLVGNASRRDDRADRRAPGGRADGAGWMNLVPVPSERAESTCANCGAALVADQRYCLSCGHPARPCGWRSSTCCRATRAASACPRSGLRSRPARSS